MTSTTWACWESLPWSEKSILKFNLSPSLWMWFSPFICYFFISLTKIHYLLHSSTVPGVAMRICQQSLLPSCILCLSLETDTKRTRKRGVSPVVEIWTQAVQKEDTSPSLGESGMVFWGRPSSSMDFPGGSDSKESAHSAETLVWSLGQEDPLEKEMATHSSILAWRIPWTEEPGGLHGVAQSWTWLSD